MSVLSKTRCLTCLLVGALLGLSAPASLRAGESNDAILTQGKSLYAQNNEELVIRHFFGDRRGGFFVDVGAYLPIKFSTTYYLEKHLGWSGIALDAMAKLKPYYLKRRPRTRFFAYIVTDHSDTMDPFYIYGPLSSTDGEHLEHFSASPEEAQKVMLPTITLNALLDRQGVKHIDFLSMDIEGGEPAALAGFDIERFRPELVCIEAGAKISGHREKLLAYFGEHDYELIKGYIEHDPINWYFRPKAKAEEKGASDAPHP